MEFDMHDPPASSPPSDGMFESPLGMSAGLVEVIGRVKVRSWSHVGTFGRSKVHTCEINYLNINKWKCDSCGRRHRLKWTMVDGDLAATASYVEFLQNKGVLIPACSLIGQEISCMCLCAISCTS